MLPLCDRSSLCSRSISACFKEEEEEEAGEGEGEEEDEEVGLKITTNS